MIARALILSLCLVAPAQASWVFRPSYYTSTSPREGVAVRPRPAYRAGYYLNLGQQRQRFPILRSYEAW